MTKSKKTLLLIICCLVFTLCLCCDAQAEAPEVFKKMGEQATSFARGFRSIAFAISGFGIIMFTFLAISGKINFKHLGYIMISLFIVSGVGLLISYMTGKDAEENLAFTQLWSDSLNVQNAGKGELPPAHANSGLY